MRESGFSWEKGWRHLFESSFDNHIVGQYMYGCYVVDQRLLSHLLFEDDI